MPNLAQPFIQGATAGQQIAQQSLATQHSQLVNQQAALTLQQNQRFSQLMASMATGKNVAGNPSDLLMSRGLMAVRAGLPQGIGLINAAVQAQTKLAAAAADTTKATAAKERADVANKLYLIKQKEEQFAPLAGALMAVHDQTTWENYLALAHQYGENDGAGMPYNPQIVDALRSKFMGVKNSIDAAKARLADQWKQANYTEKVRHDQIEESLGAARNAAAKTRAEASKIRAMQETAKNARLAKAGKVVSPPSENLVMQASDLISRQNPDLSAQDTRDFAFSVASRAKTLSVKNPGMDPEVALMEALHELTPEQLIKVPGDHFWQGDKTVFSSNGGKSSLAPTSAPPKETPPKWTAAEVKAQYPQAQLATDGWWYAPLPGGKWAKVGQ